MAIENTRNTRAWGRSRPGLAVAIAATIVPFTMLMNGGCNPNALDSPTGAGDTSPGEQPDGDAPAPGSDVGDDPPSTTPTLAFGAIGDYGDDDDNSREVADLVKGGSPDFIITVGDNDYSDGAFRGTFEGLELGVGQYFHEFIGDYAGSRGPGSPENRFFPTPGDHDWGDTCDDPRGLDDYLSYFTLPDENSGTERYYDFRQGSVHFFAIHSIEGCEPDGVTDSSVQAQWVRDTALASDATFKVAYFHNPPYSSGARHIDGGAHMRWPWKDWGFDLIMSGDDHVYERIVRDGVTYLVIGLGGLDLHEFVDDPVAGSVVRFAEDHGALRATVFDDRMEFSFITAGGTKVDSFSIHRDGDSGSTDGTPTGVLDPGVAPVTEGDWYRPTAGTSWQWQLQPGAGGSINTSYDVEVYDIDLFDVDKTLIDQLHGEGRKVVCYFSAGSFEDFRQDAGSFNTADLGNTLDGFANERWLDIRSSDVHAIMLDRLDLAVQKQCDGVEFDNIDGHANNSGFDLAANDQLAFNRFLANEGRRRGLAVALKNDLAQIPDLVAYFDMIVNEQCHEFGECALLQPFLDADKPVFNAEYASRFVEDASERQALCDDARSQGLQTLVLPLDLDDSFRFSCDP